MKTCMSVVVLGLAVAGCAVPTYLNLPPQPRDVAINNPDHPAALRIQIAAIDHVLRTYAPPGPYGLILPEDTSETSYARVLAALPAGGEQAVRQEGTVYRVAHVQIRGLKGQVNLVGPAGGHVERLISVYLQAEGASGWRVERARVWQMNADQALRLSLPEPGVVDPSSGATPAPKAADRDAPNLKDDLKE